MLTTNPCLCNGTSDCRITLSAPTKPFESQRVHVSSASSQPLPSPVVRIRYGVVPLHAFPDNVVPRHGRCQSV